MDQFVTSSGLSAPGNTASQAIDLTESQPLELTIDSIGPEQPKKRRRAITDAERRALRRQKHSNPTSTHEQLKEWFEKEHHHTITLLHAVNWAVHAWNNYVKLGTIVKCFYKSTLISQPTLGGDIDAHGEIDTEWVTQQEQDMETTTNLESAISRITQFDNPLPISSLSYQLTRRLWTTRRIY
jgi:hypothetical protein